MKPISVFLTISCEFLPFPSVNSEFFLVEFSFFATTKTAAMETQQKFCQSVGGRLADISSTKDEESFKKLQFFFASFIGVSDTVKENSFVWLSGKPLSSQ